ncbi:MAG: acylphosphatase [Gaiellaceae bacterium]|jgi:acylphosphatase
MENIRRAHLIINGRVQGVGFRYEARAFATSIGLSGWVQNRCDGAVEGVFEGPRERVELLLHWCRRGPSAAYVEGIEIEWQEPTGEQGFRIR